MRRFTSLFLFTWYHYNILQAYNVTRFFSTPSEIPNTRSLTLYPFISLLHVHIGFLVLFFIYNLVSSVIFLNIIYFAWLTSPCSLARQCALLWSETRKSLGYPLGAAVEPFHVIVQKEVLEAAVKMVKLKPNFCFPYLSLELVAVYNCTFEVLVPWYSLRHFSTVHWVWLTGYFT